VRKLFLTIIGLSAILTLALGVAFAWSETATGGPYEVGTGDLSVAIYNPQATGNLLYPTGSAIEVAYGNIQNNTLPNPGIAVKATGGFIDGISVPPCGVFDGGVSITDDSWVPPGGSAGDVWRASLTMPTWAPNSCQAGSISYTVHVNVTTP
jgi:hypothetical protein